MVPSAFVPLEQLPLTPAGKPDRHALPAPEAASTALAASYLAPRTPIEEALAEIWAELLSVEQVGIYNNFFEAGGHSLLAMQVIARASRVFGVEVPVRSLFEAPTVAGMAAAITAGLAEAAAREDVEQLLTVLEAGAAPPLA